MKILTVVFGLGKGGTQRAAQNFCEGYAALGHDSRILAIDGDGTRKSELSDANFVVWTGNNNQILQEVAEWMPDIIHLHSIGIDVTLVSMLKERCGSARFVETNVFSDRSPYTNLLEYSFQLSEWCAYNYLSRGGEKSKYVIIPNPVKTQNFYPASLAEQKAFKQRHAIPEGAFLFGRIGQHFPDKWSLYLIDAFEKFCKGVSTLTLLVMVNPPESIVEYARQRNMPNRVVVIDEIQGDEDLRSCYSAIDVFLHIANQGESFGLVLAECLLCETPVITLNTPWSDNSQAEVVGHGIGGYCVNTLREFYDQMILLYRDAALRNKMGKAGRKYISDRYEYRIVAAKSINLLTGATPPKSLRALPNFQNLKKRGLRYTLAIQILLFAKVTFFGKFAHGSIAHRSINYIIRTLLGYRMRRKL